MSTEQTNIGPDGEKGNDLTGKDVAFRIDFEPVEEDNLRDAWKEFFTEKDPEKIAGKLGKVKAWQNKQSDDLVKGIEDEEVRKAIAKTVEDYVLSIKDDVHELLRLGDQDALARKAFLITLAKFADPVVAEELSADLKDFKDAAGAEEVEKLFLEKARQTWRFALHGEEEKNDDGTPKLDDQGNKIYRPDLDGKCALEMFRRAGFVNATLEKLEKDDYVEKGQYAEGCVTLDSGGRHGLVLMGAKGTIMEGKTAVLDHHDPRISGRLSSATQETFRLLSKVGFFNSISEAEREKFGRIAEYITLVDNKTYLEDPRFIKYFRDFFDNSWRTVLGLQRKVDFDFLNYFFRENKKLMDITRKLEDDEINEYRHWLDYSNKKGETIDGVEGQKERVNMSHRIFEKFKKNGCVVDSDNYGKIVIAIVEPNPDNPKKPKGKTLPEGIDAVRAKGANTYIVWNMANQEFMINTSDRDIVDEFGQGRKFIGDRMLMKKPTFDDGPIKIRLGDVLKQMGVKDEDIIGKLKEFIDKEKSVIIEKEKGVVTEEEKPANEEKPVSKEISPEDKLRQFIVGEGFDPDNLSREDIEKLSTPEMREKFVRDFSEK